MIDIPPISDSVYFWMYRQGLKHTPLSDIEREAVAQGRTLREKDIQNYWNGYYRSDLYLKNPGESKDQWTIKRAIPLNRTSKYFDLNYSEYEEHPYTDEIEERYFPCNYLNKPMGQWGNGCMSLVDARATFGCVYIAENLKGSHRIVIDCDGDHGDVLDIETINFLSQWKHKTHCMYKGDSLDDAVSFHLTFSVDRIVPTKHLLKSHIDILGNATNQLRYYKTKTWNGLQPIPMTDEIWAEIREYGRRRDG